MILTEDSLLKPLKKVNSNDTKYRILEQRMEEASSDYFESGIYSQYYEYYRKELELIMYGVEL